MMELGIVMKATLINPDIGDMELDESGDVVTRSTLAAETAQRIFVGLQFFLGEWFMDLNEGVPYYERLLTKGPSDRVVRAIFSSIIEGTEGVAKLTQFSYAIRPDRTAQVFFTCVLVDGTTLNSRDFAPFLVEA
jgi:hypothetical protein